MEPFEPSQPIVNLRTQNSFLLITVSTIFIPIKQPNLTSSIKPNSSRFQASKTLTTDAKSIAFFIGLEQHILQTTMALAEEVDKSCREKHGEKRDGLGRVRFVCAIFLLFSNPQCRIPTGPAHARLSTSHFPLFFSAPLNYLPINQTPFATPFEFEPGYHPLSLFHLHHSSIVIRYLKCHQSRSYLLRTPCDVTRTGFSFTIYISWLNEHNDKPSSLLVP